MQALTNNLTVFVIDEAEAARRAMRRAFAGRGFETYERDTPLGATRELVHVQAHALVIDLEFSVMRGDAFIALLRRNDRLDHVAAVLVGAGSSTELSRAAEASGADGSFSKDQPLDGLAALVERLCSRRAASLASARRLELITEAAKRPSQPDLGS